VGLALPIYADQAVAALADMVTGANRDGHHLVHVNLTRDVPTAKVADLREVMAADPCPRCGQVLTMLRGIEVGHIFKLGLKYSQSLKATYLDADGAEQFIFMGCYGIGVSRIVAAAIEQGHDADGIIWPLALAPFAVALTPISLTDAKCREATHKLHNDLEAAGVEVLLDDRDERPGVKFKDADLLGIPWRVVIGPKTLEQGQAELRHRRTRETVFVPVHQVPAFLQEKFSQEIHE